MTISQPRKTTGTPAGGQFNRKTSPEADIELDDPTAMAPTAAADFGDVSNVREGSRTPWGTADWVAHTAPGAVQVSTPGHGGVKLSPERNRAVPAPLRNASGWYEEDCEAGIVAWVHPETCPQNGESPADVSASGRQTVISWFPDRYEKATGETLQPGESLMKDRHSWEATHAADEVAVAARGWGDDLPEGMVAVTVRRGGHRNSGGPARVLLVPKADYDDDANRHRLGRHPGSFVADPARNYGDITPPPAPPKPPRHRHRTIDTSRLTSDQRYRAETELARRWKVSDGSSRTLSEIVEGGGIVGKIAIRGANGRHEYHLSLASEPEGAPESEPTYALPVSKATWDAVDTAGGPT